ncbi:uncharacterized protein LOC120335889 [Styela clava]|uniref:uncharacterized protein LOC120335889 n=1 Tax=Styela clava TaxID=7725 RepID=UPI001939D909|nr:uncharacterized protein LOC120335889 [Styela clava]
MFRYDNAADGGIGGSGGGGVSSRKAHPIFKTKSASDGGSTSNSYNGSGFWNLFVCSINLNNSDPRFRPPICCVIVGTVVIAIGIVALSFREYTVVLTSGAVVTVLGAAIVIISFVWLFITRQKILKALPLKAATISRTCPEHGVLDDCYLTKQKLPPDPIMSRGLVSIYYRSCEDTIPGFKKNIPGTKSVRVPPTEGFTPVESTCFQLISGKVDKTSGTIHRAPDLISGDESQGEEKYIAPRRASTENGGRTLPATPRLNSNIENEMKKQLDEITHTRHVPKQNSEPNSYQPEPHRGSNYDQSRQRKRSDERGNIPSRNYKDQIITVEQNSQENNRKFKDHGRMSTSHANVYRTDFQPNKRHR